MKFFSDDAPPKQSDRQTARACLVTNAVVLPGLGSIAAGRRVGYAQAAVALAGFVVTVLFAGWLIRSVAALPRLPETIDQWRELLPRWAGWLKLGGLGFALFGGAWLWALATSLRLLREHRANGAEK